MFSFAVALPFGVGDLCAGGVLLLGVASGAVVVDVFVVVVVAGVTYDVAGSWSCWSQFEETFALSEPLPELIADVPSSMVGVRAESAPMPALALPTPTC